MGDNGLKTPAQIQDFCGLVSGVWNGVLVAGDNGFFSHWASLSGQFYFVFVFSHGLVGLSFVVRHPVFVLLEALSELVQLGRSKVASESFLLLLSLGLYLLFLDLLVLVGDSVRHLDAVVGKWGSDVVLDTILDNVCGNPGQG